MWDCHGQFLTTLVGAQRLIGNHMLVNHILKLPYCTLWHAAHNFAILGRLWKMWYFSVWWFQIFFIFTLIWRSFPIWLILFRWVETTNYCSFRYFTDFVEPPNAYYITKYLENNVSRTVSHLHVPSRKLTWLWKINHIQKMYVLLNMDDFPASHVSFSRCYVYWQMLGEVQIHRLQPFAHLRKEKDIAMYANKVRIRAIETWKPKQTV